LTTTKNNKNQNKKAPAALGQPEDMFFGQKKVSAALGQPRKIVKNTQIALKWMF